MFGMKQEISGFKFDDSNVTWHEIEGIEHLQYHICDVDEVAQIADVLFKVTANQTIMMHRHHAAYKTLILQGELQIFNSDGSLKEVRPVGSYVSTEVTGEPHTDRAGDMDLVVLFSNRGTDGVIYEFLDENLNTAFEVGMPELKELWAAQTKAPYELERA